MTKVALVTGAARGIGRAIALRLADDGLDVAINDLTDEPELDAVRQEIEAKGRRSLTVPADVSLEPNVVRIIGEVVEKLGSLDVVNCLPPNCNYCYCHCVDPVDPVDGC
jgi:meso-butanediol dehydrogenase / (S,S)-butanediol dehydrogenase / diacetyl reductase